MSCQNMCAYAEGEMLMVLTEYGGRERAIWPSDMLCRRVLPTLTSKCVGFGKRVELPSPAAWTLLAVVLRRHCTAAASLVETRPRLEKPKRVEKIRSELTAAQSRNRKSLAAVRETGELAG